VIPPAASHDSHVGGTGSWDVGGVGGAFASQLRLIPSPFLVNLSGKRRSSQWCMVTHAINL